MEEVRTKDDLGILHSDFFILTLFLGIPPLQENLVTPYILLHLLHDMSIHILHVAYDRALLETRDLMLKSRGYAVTSALGNQQAMALSAEELARYDAVVIGFSSTHAVRSAAVQWFKAKSPELPVVILQVHDFEKFPQADCATPSEDPTVWLQAVAQCVGVTERSVPRAEKA